RPGGRRSAGGGHRRGLSRGRGSAGRRPEHVPVAPRARPHERPRGGLLEVPSGPVLGPQVVAGAQRPQVVDLGGPAETVVDGVVEVAAMGWHGTGRERAGAVPGFDMATLTRGGPPPGDAGDDGEAGGRVGDVELPGAVGVLAGYVAGEIGDHRAPAVQLPGLVGETDERDEI